MYPQLDSNLVKAVMNLFDCFLDDLKDEKLVKKLTDLEIRAQLEV